MELWMKMGYPTSRLIRNGDFGMEGVGPEVVVVGMERRWDAALPQLISALTFPNRMNVMHAHRPASASRCTHSPQAPYERLNHSNAGQPHPIGR